MQFLLLEVGIPLFCSAGLSVEKPNYDGVKLPPLVLQISWQRSSISLCDLVAPDEVFDDEFAARLYCKRV